MKRTDTDKLIGAMVLLSCQIQSGDGIANAAIAEAAGRLREQSDEIKRLSELLAEAVQREQGEIADRVAAENEIARQTSIADALFDIAIGFELKWQDGAYWVFNNGEEGELRGSTKQELLDKLPTWRIK